MKNHHFALMFVAGLVLTCLIAYAARPDVLGVKVDMSVLFSSHPVDRPFRAMLLDHLLTYGSVGAFITSVVVAFWIGVTRRHAV